MRNRTRFWIPMLVVVLASAACTAEQTQEGELPDVDVKGGQAPEFDVDPATVRVGTDTQTVTVPNIDVEPARDTTP
jgi:hypothetical protein